MYVSNLEYLDPFRRYLPSKFEVIQNHPQFSMFLERAPKIFNLDYKTEHTSDHGAKFRADQPRQLEYLTTKTKKVNKWQTNKSPLRKLTFSGKLIN